MRTLPTGLAASLLLTFPVQATDDLALRGAAEHVSGSAGSPGLSGRADILKPTVATLSRQTGAGPMPPDTLFRTGRIARPRARTLNTRLSGLRHGLPDTCHAIGTHPYGIVARMPPGTNRQPGMAAMAPLPGSKANTVGGPVRRRAGAILRAASARTGFGSGGPT